MNVLCRGLAAIVVVLTVSAVAVADSVDFAVGAVSITIEATNFQLTEAQAFLRCHLEEPSGTYSGYPTERLSTKLTELGAGTVAGSTRYQLEAEAGQLSDWRIYAELRGCEYGLNVKSSTSASEISLAGALSRMSRSELNGFLADVDLAEKISRQHQVLFLLEKRGAIEKF